jgi:hypothetical protein
MAFLKSGGFAPIEIMGATDSDPRYKIRELA